MKTEHINELLRTPNAVSVDDLSGLHQLVESYPWCQSFQVLYAKALKENDDPRYSQQLKKTAVYSTDRKVLYRLLIQEGVQQSIATFGKLTEADLEEEHAPEETAPTEQAVPSPVAETTTTAPEVSSVDEPQPEPETDEEYLLDPHNLEQEVLKEVAARAYALEFESTKLVPEEKTKQPEPIALESTEPPVEEKPKKPAAPISFVDFISGKVAGVADNLPASEEKSEDEERLIDRFILNEPKIERRQSDFFSPVNMGKMSLIDSDELVTETLAEIYAKQGDTAKAKRAYQQLTLKYPEKSIYFASLIKKLEQSKSKK